MTYHYECLDKTSNLYKKLEEIETNIRTSPSVAVIFMRQALEIICAEDNVMLGDKTFALHNRIIKLGEGLKMTKESIEEALSTKNKGNKAVHYDLKQQSLRTYKVSEAVEQLSELHSFLKTYLRISDNYKIDLMDFDADMLPFLDYKVVKKLNDEEFTMVDSINEYLVYKESKYGLKTFFVVRELDSSKIKVLDHSDYVYDLISNAGGQDSNNIIRYNELKSQEDIEVLYSLIGVPEDFLRLDRLDTSQLDLPAKIGLLRQISSGIACLQSLEKPVVHRAIMPQNIIVEIKGEELTAKLANFEYSKVKNPLDITVKPELRKQMKKGYLDETYLAPEVKHLKNEVGLADNYSLGALVFYIMNSKSRRDKDLAKTGLNDELMDMSYALLEDDHQMRLSIKDFMEGIDRFE